MSIGKYVAAFVTGLCYSQAGRKPDPLTRDTEDDKHEMCLSVPCAMGWVNSLMQTVLQIMLWMGWSNLSLILLEPSCFNRLSFHNLLIHHPFAFTSQWANIAKNHYYKLHGCECNGRSHFPLLTVQHHLPLVLTSPLGTARSPVPAQITFSLLPCAPQGPGNAPVSLLLANPPQHFRHLLLKCPKLFLKTGNKEPMSEPRAAGHNPQCSPVAG